MLHVDICSCGTAYCLNNLKWTHVSTLRVRNFPPHSCQLGSVYLNKYLCKIIAYRREDGCETH